MKKILQIFSSLVIILFLLSLFGWMVNQISNKKKEFGILTEPIKFMYSFPDLFEETVVEVKSLPPTFLPTPTDFEKVNQLEKDLIVLTTYSDTNDLRSIVLMNLRNDSILKKWTVENPWGKTGRIVNPLLHPDGSMIYNYYYWAKPGLTKVDSNDEVVWKNDSLVVHHGMNLNKEGDIWTCTIRRGKSGGAYILAGEKVFYNDYGITKYDHETGKIIFHKSITAILRENDLENYLLKSAQTDEPIHLNDVQPALKTTEYYQEDDVFISLRNINMILHYRPSTNQLIDFIEGPFVHQHDIDFLNDSILVLFNNNTHRIWPGQHIKKAQALKDKSQIQFAGEFHNNIVSYDLKTKEFAIIGNEVFRENRIHTVNEGLVEFIDSATYFVEEQNPGILWVIKEDEVLYKNVLSSPYEDHHHLPNWTRIIRYGDEFIQLKEAG